MFTGRLDGKDHQITGLTTDGVEGGLFDYLWGGTVQNLAICGYSLVGSSSLGPVCGVLFVGTIAGCTTSGIIRATSAAIGGLYDAQTGTLITAATAGFTAVTGMYALAVYEMRMFLGIDRTLRGSANGQDLEATTAVNGGVQATDGLPIVYWPGGTEPVMTATIGAVDMYSLTWMAFLNAGKGAYVGMTTQDMRIPATP